MQGLTEAQIWRIADVFVASSIIRLEARAELSVLNIISVELRVVPAEPPPRHANIESWPTEKHLWMSKAQQLAAVAQLRLREP
jgi:hypothetical protein